MKEVVYLITDKNRENFLCRNTNGRYFGKPKKVKDIITYPTKDTAKNVLVNGLTYALEGNPYVVAEFILTISEKCIIQE